MSTYEYAAPAFILAGTEEAIHQAMMDYLPGDIDKTEGGFVWDATRTSAMEMAQSYIALNEAIKLIYPMYSYSGWLDLHGLTRSILRKEAVKAAGKVNVTGVANLVVPAGFQFSSSATNNEPNVIFESTEEVQLDAEGKAEIPVVCTEAGYDGNMPANSVVMMVYRLIGISSVTNDEPMTGGTDEESDDDLRDRIVAADLSGEESFVGSASDYKRWAMAVPGVGGAVIIPTWNGPGSVKIVIVDEEGKPANAKIIQDVTDYILSPNDPDLRLAPINALGTVTIVAPTSRAISVSARIKLADSFTLETAKESFRTALAAYYNTAAEEGVMRYNMVGSILISLDDVEDYDDLTIDGGVENITIAADEYPMLGDFTVVSYA